MKASREIFSRIKDDTSSLLFLRDAQSTDTHRSIGSQNLATVNTNFSFDHEICTTKVYRMALRSNMTQNILSEKQQKTDTVEHADIVSSRRTIRPVHHNGSVADGPLASPPRLHERGVHALYSGITQEVSRLSSSTDTQMEPDRAITGIAAASTSHNHEDGTSSQSPLLTVESGLTGSMGTTSVEASPHRQVLSIGLIKSFHNSRDDDTLPFRPDPQVRSDTIGLGL